MSTKRRRTSSFYRSRFINGGYPGYGDGLEWELAHTVQSVLSQGHAFQMLGKQKNWNIGGPFDSKKVSVELSADSEPQWVRQRAPEDGSGREWAYEYFTYPLPPGVFSRVNQIRNLNTANQIDFYLAGQVPGFTPQELDALGAEAVDRFAPLSPVADVATTLAELFSERKFFNVPGNAGSLPGEYLNYQFGVAPTVAFAQDLRQALQDKEKVVSQIARDSGRRIRRRGVVYEVPGTAGAITTTGVFPEFIGPGVGTSLMSRGTMIKSTLTSRKAWFSGCFTYYLPKEGLPRTVAELDALYGVRPGLDTAWELLPFSWLVDYKTSLGSAIANANRFAQDGLVMPYGYIMATTETVETYEWTGGLNDSSGNLRTVTLVATIRSIRKQRTPANPFGFGILPGDLSTRQLSILAALGLTYLRR